MPIKLLDNSLINKIAAGEVVERPSSVVKELVENAVDAGATEIVIEIENGGKSLIKISDNGCGINHDELLLAFSRHATSKISSLTDLENIASLGFRGEALSSISSVSNVEVITKTKDDELAKSVELSQGEVINEKYVQRLQGTTFIVRDLFFNVPVRLKFLKKNSVESGSISEIVTNLILSNPNVSFKFINNGQTLLRSDGDGNLEKILQQIAGSDLRNNLIKVDYKDENVEVTGVISNFNVSKSTRKNEYLFINSRFVKNKMINDVVESYYNGKFEGKKYPVFALNLKMNPHDVDVNVHPTKLEVRFADESAIFEAFNNAMTQALESITDNDVASKIPSIDFKLDKNSDIRLVENKKNQAINQEVAPKVIQFEQLDISSIALDNLLDEVVLDDALLDEVSLLNETNITSNINTNTNNSYENKNLKYENTLNTNTNFLNDVALDEKLDTNVEDNIGKVIANYLYSPSVNEIANTIQKNQNYDYQKPKITEIKNKEVKNQEIKNQNKTTFVDNRGEVKFNKTDANKETKHTHDYKVLGQVFGTYWLLEKGDDIFFFDQHAGHEIYLYYKFLDDFKNSKIYSQVLLEPKIISLDFKQSDYLLNNLDLFKQFGYDVEVFNDNIYSLKGVPIIFDEPSSVQFFNEIVTELSEMDSEMESTTDNLYDLKTETIMMMSCRSAVKANDRLTEVEAREIIDKVLSDETLLKCPHGRPTLIKLSRKDIERMFKRC